jgi:V/A-type H+-transporting ATPase subunit I
MSIVGLDKVTIIGHQDNKDSVFMGLQALGCLHLIPLTAEGQASPSTGPSKDAQEALHFLVRSSHQRRQVTDPKRFDAIALEGQALGLQRQLYKLRNRRDFLSTRIDNLAPWGDFEFPHRDQLGGQRFWFFQVPHHEIKHVEKSDLLWEVVDRDARFFYVIVVSADEPEGMPVARVHAGARSRNALLEELEKVELELEDVEAERASLTRWCTLFARALDGLEDRATRNRAAGQTAEAEPVYALQAWIPHNCLDTLYAFAKENTLAIQSTLPEEGEDPPTLFRNAAPLRAGEDLVAFYMTPSYWLWDPSSVVFLSFALFFAMIVADAGYALLLAGIVVLYRKRLASSATGLRWRVMLLVLAGATAVYGMLAGSYFGVTPAADSPLGFFHVLDLGDFTVMMTLSVIIGASHISYACLMDGLRYLHWPQRLPPLGWAGAVFGGLLAWLGMQFELPYLQLGGIAMFVIGLTLVVAFSGYGEKPLARALKGIIALAGVSGAFGDVLSYLRLFALGLASASLAMAFNDMAKDVQQAIPGIGFLFGILILLLGHSLNFLLSVSSGFIHGLRLNVIEFFKWGVKDEGNPYRPFERKESI